jgi:hypothetical protein
MIASHGLRKFCIRPFRELIFNEQEATIDKSDRCGSARLTTSCCRSGDAKQK